MLDPGDIPAIRREVRSMKPVALFKRSFFRRIDGGISLPAGDLLGAFPMFPLSYSIANEYLSKVPSVPLIQKRRVDVACSLRRKFNQPWRGLTATAVAFFFLN